MTIKQLINRAYMQVGDTSHVNYTPFQFLEYYNEGNQLLCHLIAKYMPDEAVDDSYKEIDDESGWDNFEETMLVHYMVTRILNLDMAALLQEWENWIAEKSRSEGGSNVVIARGYWDYDGERTDYHHQP
jgi:hypothetical protein